MARTKGEGRPHACWRKLRSGQLVHDGPTDCTVPRPEVVDDPVQGSQSDGTVVAEVPVDDLPPDPSGVSEGPGVDGRPATDPDDEAVVVSQEPKATPRRGRKPAQEPTEQP